MKHFDAFAGMGGFTLALKNVLDESYENIGFSEIDKHAVSCYQYHFPKHKNYGDITTIRPGDIGHIDIITGGFPCQTFSIAGKRRGFEDTRGTLFFEIARICAELQPKYILLENVKGLLNHESGRTFSAIYRTLIDIGYTVEFQVVNTKWFLPQNRERVFIVGHFTTNGGSFKPIFPIGENDKTFERTQAKQKSCTYINAPKVAGCLTGGGNSGGLHSDMTTIEIGTLRTHNHGKGFRKIKENIAPTLPARAREDGSGQPVIKQLARGNNKGADFDICPTISSNAFQENNFVSGLRRLTEIECERLQGFPDDYTRYGIYDDIIKEIPKTQRYKMIGNSISVPVVEEIVKRLVGSTDKQ